MFQTDCFICGLAPFKEDLIILAFPEQGKNILGSVLNVLEKGAEKSRPELRIMTRTNEDVSTEALSINGYQFYNAIDYRLDHLTSESLFYIVSPKGLFGLLEY
jgi:hypothetical protein